MDDETKTELKHSEAIKELACDAREALKVIADAAAAALKTKAIGDTADHDTITNLVSAVDNIDKKFTEKFGEVRNDIKEIKDGTAAKIAKLEDEKNNKADSYIKLFKEGVDNNFKDVYARVVALETSKVRQNTTMGIGVAVLSLLVTLLVVHMFK